MEKIRLSKDEKILLRALQMGDMETPLLSYGQRYLAACSLSRKGLVDLALNYDKIESIKMTYECKAYMQANPSLKNPVDWCRILEIFFMGITAFATCLALITCCKI